MGFGALNGRSGDSVSEMPGFLKNKVFDGLTANRRSCVVCGYTEAVMHFAFDNWQLVVPRLVLHLAFVVSPFFSDGFPA